MNQKDRELLDKLDKLVTESSGEDFKKIQEIDILTQMDGKSLYDSYFDSSSLKNPSIKSNSIDSKK